MAPSTAANGNKVTGNYTGAVDIDYYSKLRFTHFTFSGPCIVICLLDKYQKDALFFLNLLKVIYPLHVPKRVTIHHQQAVTVYAVYTVTPC
jgi:hypothetical protein